MQVFVPYQSPYDCAEVLSNDSKRFNKQIVELNQILKAIDGVSKAWANHPVTKMYTKHRNWLLCYLECFKAYKANHFNTARAFDNETNGIKPYFLTDEFCDQHKRRLFTKAPNLYPQFASYGTSEENWYFVNGKLLKYINGKKL